MKVLVVDDHVLIRDAMRGVFAELKPLASVLEAVDSREAMAMVAQHADLKLIVLDLNLPDRDGFAVLAEFRERYPAIAVVVLSANQDRESVTRALDLGAAGFITKSGQRAVMLGALQIVFAGGIYVPPEILDSAATVRQGGSRRSVDTRLNTSPIDLGLTERQLQVLALILKGKSNKAIARQLDLAEPTVKNHVTSILRALNVTNRTEAVVAINAMGWKLPLRANN